MCCFVPAPQSIDVEPMLNSAGIPKANDLQVWELLAMLVCWWLKRNQFFLKHSNLRPRLEGVTLGIAGTIEERRSNWWNQTDLRFETCVLFWSWSHWNQTYPATFEDWWWSIQITIWELGVAITCHLKHSRLAKLQFVILDSVSGGSNLDSLKLRLRKPSGNLGRVFRKIHVLMKLGLDSFQWNCRGVDAQRVIWPACPKGRSQQRSMSLVCRRANECLQDTDNLRDENVLQKGSKFEVIWRLKFFSFMSLTWKAFVGRHFHFVPCLCHWKMILATFPETCRFLLHTHLWGFLAMSEPSTQPPPSSPSSLAGEVKGDREFREHVEWMAFLPAVSVSPHLQRDAVGRFPKRCETVKRTRCDSLDGTVDFLVALRCFIPWRRSGDLYRIYSTDTGHTDTYRTYRTYKKTGSFSADVAETAVDTWSQSREKQYAGTVHIWAWHLKLWCFFGDFNRARMCKHIWRMTLEVHALTFRVGPQRSRPRAVLCCDLYGFMIYDACVNWRVVQHSGHGPTLTTQLRCVPFWSHNSLYRSNWYLPTWITTSLMRPCE